MAHSTSTAPTKAALIAQIAMEQQLNARLKNIGAEMANLCFTGQQDAKMPERYREQMVLLLRRWDEAVRTI